MALILETTLWVDFTRKKTPPELKATILPWIMDVRASLCEIVAFEVLRHATVDERNRIAAQFATLPLLPTPSTLWQDAARLGQACRDSGFNAGSLDLLIAAIAIHHDAELVTFDTDFSAIAKASPLQVILLNRSSI